MCTYLNLIVSERDVALQLRPMYTQRDLYMNKETYKRDQYIYITHERALAKALQASRRRAHTHTHTDTQTHRHTCRHTHIDTHTQTHI